MQAAIRRRIGTTATVTSFLAPAVAFYILFTAYPVLRTFYNAFFLLRPNRGPVFVGLANFAQVLGGDDIFWASVRHTLLWSVVSPTLEISIAVLLAVALYARVPGGAFFRVAWFAPVLFSYVVVGIVWMWIYNPDWGPLNTLLRLVGLNALARFWLSDPAVALPALIGITVWMWTGFNMVVLLSAIHALPAEVLEAAEIDGCGWGRKLLHIILPLLRPTMLSLFVLSFIGKMKVFDLVWVTTQGRPLWATETFATYLFKRAFHWNTFDLGYPSAMASVWFVVSIGCVGGLTLAFKARSQ